MNAALGWKGRRTRAGTRRGAVTVEMAIVAPVLVTIVFGMVETCRIYEIQNLMSLASREGARLTAMDREGLLLEGQSTNAKVEADIKNYLGALGFDKDELEVSITAPGSSTAFDLDDPDNEFQLFRIRVAVPYCETCEAPPPGVEPLVLAAAITFRNGRVPKSD